MTSDQKDITSDIAAETESRLRTTEKGHGWWHVSRVWQNAKSITEREEGRVDAFVVELAALLHDIADPKFHDGDEEVGPRTAREIMEGYDVSEETIDHVVKIIRYMSFKNTLDGNTWESPELLIVQDADRLDAIGAVGIARAFHYGGHKDRAIYDPEVAPILQMDKESYQKSEAPTINHFYEKLLKLKDRMNTPMGRALAQERHDFMLAYLRQFYSEVGAVPAWHEE